jgi:ATP-binding cassette, subfamily B, multidrug efflux pump
MLDCSTARGALVLSFGGRFVKQLLRSLKFLSPYVWFSLGSLLSLLIATGAVLLLPRLGQLVIDQGIAAGDLSRVYSLSATMVGLGLARALFQFAQGALAARTAQGVAYDLRNQLYSRIQSLSFSYHDRAQTGQLLTRATSDVDRVQMFIGRGAVMFLSAVFMLAGALTLLFQTNWRLALLIVFVVPVTFALFGIFARTATPLFKEVQRRLSDLNVVLQENLAGVRVVKAFAREPYEAGRFEDANRDLYDISIRVNNVMSLAFPTVFSVSNIATLVIYWVGGTQVIVGTLTTGELVAFAAYVMMAFFPVLMMGMIITMLSQAGASAERIFEILDADIEVRERPDATRLARLEGRVAFEDVCFRYYATGDPVLDGISFVAEPGQTIALLGASGSGKSSVINLIPRFYDVCEGRVTVDGHDVREVTLESLRSQIGIVLQETNLFEGSIRDNIAFGKPDASDDEVARAAEAAEAADFIQSFADGYQTHVGERGVTLSGGQKQRIAIARALLTDPRILILDDATSSVDLATELRIQKALDRLMEGRTSFVIAQRVATVLNADLIIVLDRGRVVAKGTHENLLRESEIYAEIYSSQLDPDRTLVDAQSGEASA